MDLKEIFKPTAWKIIIFAFLFVFFVPFIKPHAIMCITTPCPQYGLQTVFSQNFLLKIPIVGIDYTYLALGLVLDYLISCSLVLLFLKIRK